MRAGLNSTKVEKISPTKDPFKIELKTPYVPKNSAMQTLKRREFDRNKAQIAALRSEKNQRMKRGSAGDVHAEYGSNLKLENNFNIESN